MKNKKGVGVTILRIEAEKRGDLLAWEDVLAQCVFQSVTESSGLWVMGGIYESEW